MCPCNPNDIHIDLPAGPSGVPVPGFGIPWAIKLPINPIPEGFPEDLLDLFNKLQMLLPPGSIKPNLSLNFEKDVFDAIMKLLNQFMPFLMLYKFFLPVLNLIICIIEVLCAISNPFKLVRAMKRLFRKCLPDFLNLFPVFALIVMLISLLMLLLALIEYIINQILKLIKLLIRQMENLYNATVRADDNSILTIARKIGSILCIFQNLFVLLSLFNIIFQIVQDMLALVFSIPPCDSSDPSNVDGCCTPEVCPDIVKTSYKRDTGNLYYVNKVGFKTNITFPPPFGDFNVDIRQEAWQIFDEKQEIYQRFAEIIDAHDVTEIPKPIFFPVDGVYNATTTPKQAPYTIDLRLYYNPASWNRDGYVRYIQFYDCIVTKAPTYNYVDKNNNVFTKDNAVLLLAGGLGYEDNGDILKGYGTDGVTPISDQATLENFLHKPDNYSIGEPVYDGYEFQNIQYSFKPNVPVLINKNLVTLGCEPSLALNKAFINQVFANDAQLKYQLLGQLFHTSTTPSTNFPGASFPNPNQAQECLQNSITALKANLTLEGIAEFQTTTTLCLQKLKDDTNSTLPYLIGLGFDPCKSKIQASTTKQFTTKPITVSILLNEGNSLPLVNGVSTEIGASLASKIKAYPTLGQMVGDFVYDGYQLFTADLISDKPGTGTLVASFDNQMLCTNTIPDNVDEPPSHDLQQLTYQFVYSTAIPASIPGTTESGEGSTIGTESAGDDTARPRRDEGDSSRDKE
jgi:hypothetical protein